jgi:hypothetical protein
MGYMSDLAVAVLAGHDSCLGVHTDHVGGVNTRSKIDLWQAIQESL